MRQPNSACPPSRSPRISASGLVPPFLTYSAHPAVSMPSVSRAVMTTCTSAGASDSTSRRACSRPAPHMNSWVSTPGPLCRLTALTSRASVPGAFGWRCSRCGRSCSSRAAHRCSRWPRPGSRNPSAASGGLRPPQHRLEVGRAGLRQTDVEEDLRGHGGWLRRSGGTSRAARPASSSSRAATGSSSSVTMSVSSARRTLSARHSWTSASSRRTRRRRSRASPARVERSRSTRPDSFSAISTSPFHDQPAHLRGRR